MSWMKTWGVGHFITVLSVLLALVFVSFVLRAKRPPGSTMAWLIFILAVPYVGIPLYIFLSQRKFQTRLYKKKSLYEQKGPTASIALGGGELEKMLSNFGVSPPRLSGNLQIIDSGESGFEAVKRLLESATKTVHLTTFIFADDPVGLAILGLLEQKARAGVQVRLLVDSFGAMWVRHPSFKKLTAAGGRVARFMPFFHLPFKGRTNLRNHRKIFVVDSAAAIVGGMNIAEEYMGSGQDHWIDVALKLTGEAVGDLEIIFREDWEFASGERIPLPVDTAIASPRSSVGPSGIDSQGRVQIIASGPDVKGDPLYDFLLSLIFEARKRIWIATPYFIPDESLCKALELASRRGVEVRIWVPRKSNHSLADLARASYLHDLFDARVSVKLVTRMMHGKAVMIDDTCGIVGSANFDMRSLLLNYELGAVIFSRPILSSLENWFARMPVESLEAWPTKGYFTDLFEGIGRVVGPLI